MKNYAIYKKAKHFIANNSFDLWGKLYLENYKIQNTIMVCSSARGGSTWLAQIISSIPGYPLLWEPLHLGTSPSCVKYGFKWGTYLKPDTEDEMKYNYIQDVLTGKNLSTELISSMYFNPIQFLRFNGFVVKFTLANMMLPWILKNFPIRCILLIRHPCAVVSSRLLHSAWDHVNIENFYIEPEVFIDFPHLKEIFESISTREELFAFSWVMQTLIPLSCTIPHPWYLTTYEKLLMDAEAEVENIFDYLGEDLPPDANKMLKKPSKTTSKNAHVFNRNNPLSLWKENLSSKQIELILNIVNRSGIDFYNKDLEPDLNLLLNYKIAK